MAIVVFDYFFTVFDAMEIYITAEIIFFKCMYKYILRIITAYLAFMHIFKSVIATLVWLRCFIYFIYNNRRLLSLVMSYSNIY